MKRHLYILGAGPCGLAAAHDLSQAGESVTLIEGGSALGGLAQSVAWGASQMDLGPHKLFTIDPAHWQKVRSFLPDAQWISHPKVSHIYMNGHYLSYPPRAMELAETFGLTRCIGAAWDLLLAQWGFCRVRCNDQETFETDAVKRVGRSLYTMLFQPLARKIWGDPATLDAQLSQSRIQVPSIRAALKQKVSGKKSEAQAWQASSYFYPKGGLGVLWQAIAKQITDNGGEIVLGERVERWAREDRHVTSFTTSSGKQWNLHEGDWVLSTIPLSLLANSAWPAFPDDIRQAAGALTLHDLYLVFLKVSEDIMKDDAWIFIPDETIAFHRLSAQHKFDPGMVEPGRQLVCCEIMSYAGRALFGATDAKLVEACIAGLRKMNRLQDAGSVLDARVIRLPASYPVMTQGYQAEQERALAYFDGFDNLRTIGRQGAYNYIGSLDAMDTGFGAARWLLAGPQPNSWPGERQRTKFYPILD